MIEFQIVTMFFCKFVEFSKIANIRAFPKYHCGIDLQKCSHFKLAAFPLSPSSFRLTPETKCNEIVTFLQSLWFHSLPPVGNGMFYAFAQKAP